MTLQTQIPPTQSHLGLALRLQVVSALLIIGGLLTLSNVIPLLGTSWVIASGILYAIGFLQLIILRTLLQKAEYSVHSAGVLAFLAGLLSIITSSYLQLMFGWDWRIVTLETNVVVNIVLFYCYFNIHRDGGIRLAFSPKEKNSTP